MNFRELHKSKDIFVIGNIWDVQTAMSAQTLGFDAVATSSAAIANTLGFDDGEEMPFADLLFIVERISDKISIPLSVDIESGYSRNASDITSHIKQLAALGVSGINIEDSIVENGKRALIDIDEFASTIKRIQNELKHEHIDIFINVRTDPYLIGEENPLAETIKRTKAFDAAGADGIFIPGVVNQDDIEHLVSTTMLPLNVYAMPDLSDFPSLQAIGVKRLSSGNWVHQSMHNYFVEKMKNVKASASFAALFNH